MSIALNASRDNGLTIAEQFGWHVFPVLPGLKRPLSAHGQDDASNDPDTIRRLFSGSGMANLGIHCRPSGLYVIDVDMNPWKGKRGEATWEALTARHGHVETYTVRSWSGGLHFYYSHPEGFLTNTSGERGGLGLDIDTRGNGYVLHAPSFVREDGHEGTYEVIDARQPAPLPQWIIEALTKPEPKAFDGTGVLADTDVVVRRVQALADELAVCTSSANHFAASQAVKVGNYVGAGQISRDQAEQIILGALAGWSWAAPQDEQTMHNTIRRQIDFGAQRSDRPWEAPVKKSNGLYDPWANETIAVSVPKPPLTVVKDDGVPDSGGETEIGHGQYRMAQRMLRASGTDLRFSKALGWHVWDGKRWKPDEDDSTVHLAQKVINDSYAAVPHQGDSDQRKELIKDITKVESASGLEGMLYHLRAMPPVAAGLNPFDKNANLFNTPNATIDLQSGDVRPHSREDMNAKMSNAGIGSERSKVFEDFLERILPDPEVRAYVQRLFGQAMLGRVEEHIMPIFTGSGRNGKGTLRDAVLYAFGDYALEIDPKILLEQKNDIHKTYEMELMGRRLVFCSETKKDRRFDAASMKRIVGGDQLQGQRMHKDPVSFDPTHTLIMLTNDLPKIDPGDTAAWARLRVIPFNVVIPPEERDGTLPHRLKDAAPAVMAWVYEGWLEYQKQGLNEPEAVLARTQTYHNENDSVGKFLAERTQPNVNSFLKAQEFYEEYTKYCRDDDLEILSQAAVSKSLIAAGGKKIRRNSGNVYQGFLILALPDE